jgi:hypothetical protein
MVDEKNKRHLTRIGFHTKIEIFFKNRKIAEAETENLSIKGVLLKSKELKKSDHCRVAINLPGEPDAPKLEIEGLVVRAQKSGETAIFFEKMELETFSHLKNIISLNDGDPEKIQQEFMDHIKSHCAARPQPK